MTHEQPERSQEDGQAADAVDEQHSSVDQQPVTNPAGEPVENAAAGSSGSEEQPPEEEHGGVTSHRWFGTFVYVYFALFVVVHVLVMIDFLVRVLNPWVGVIIWMVMMVLGGVSVVALAVWRDHLHTYFGSSD